MDFGNFLQQVFPLVSFYLIIPAVLIALYFVIRQFRRRTAQSNAPKAVAETASTQTSSPEINHFEDFDEEPSALDLLAQARAESDETEEEMDDFDLPDMDALLGGLEPEPVPAKANGTGRIPLNTGGSVRAKSLITVLRDEDSGRLLVEMDGQGYYTLVDTPEAKKLFKAIMQELSNVIMTPMENHPEPEGAPEETLLADLRAAEIAKEKAEELPPAPITPREFSNTPPPPIDTDGAMPGDLPSYKMDDLQVKIEGRGLRKAKVSIETPPELDIAGSIDAYLQHRLRYTPEMDGNKIAILPSRTGGVRIVVNGTGYDAVDEVAEPDVRAFIQQSIAEWQERQ